MRRYILFALLLVLLPQPDASAPHERALTTVENPAPGTAARLLDAGVVVLRDLGGYLITLATPDDRELFARLSLEFQVLDDDPGGKTYYVASPLLPAIDRYGARARVFRHSAFGDVIEATPDEADALAATGVEIARLFMTPMRAPVIEKPAPRVAPLAPDSVVQAMVDSVSINNINATVQHMQDFVNRYSLGDSVNSARDWLVAQFESFGIDSVTTQEFDPLYGENVIAVLPGVGHPEKLVVVGGHYDSTAPGFEIAPGADDNATGTSCVLECARILSQHQFDYTLVFVAFCGEEQGLIGSEAFAAQAEANGDDIVGMLNVDMIGYVWAGDLFTDLDIVSNTSSQWMRDLLMDVAVMYVPELPVVDGSLPGGSNSDHASFWRHGFDAIMFWEDTDNWSPWIHSDGDLVGQSYNSPVLAEGSVKIAVAFLSTLAERFRVIIQHTPVADSENVQSTHRVVATLLHAGPLDPDSLYVQYVRQEADIIGSVRTSALNDEFVVPLVYLGWGDAYEAIIPPQSAGTVIDYFIVANNADGFRALHPKTAPDDTHRFVVGTPSIIVEDNFATDTGWTAGVPGDNATDGFWLRAAPVRSFINEDTIQPGIDHTPGVDSLCFVTGNFPSEASHGLDDVDFGKTTLLSPQYDLSQVSNAWAHYYRWYTNDSGGNIDDVWTVDVSSDGGQSWVRVETLARSQREWSLVRINLRDFVNLSSAMQFRFVAEDIGAPSVVEALIDDFQLITYTGATTSAGGPPSSVRLEQNYPNPFNPRTTISFVVTPPGDRTTLRVYDVSGRLVTTLLDREFVSGDRVIQWDGRNRHGQDVASGVYFYRLVTDRFTTTRKMVLLK